MTMRTRIRTLIAVFTASLLIPKMPSRSMGYVKRSGGDGGNALQEGPPEGVPDGEEHEDGQRDHHRDQRHHGQHARTAVVHNALACRRPRGLTRSATR